MPGLITAFIAIARFDLGGCLRDTMQLTACVGSHNRDRAKELAKKQETPLIFLLACSSSISQIKSIQNNILSTQSVCCGTITSL